MAKIIIDAVTAQKLLDNNTHNRKISNARVAEYAKEMATDMWIYNGESIIVSESGRLLDGQHRLLAIIQADAEIEVEFITNVPDIDNGVDTFLTINTKNRSNSDALYIDGFKEDTANIVKLMRFKEAFNEQRLLQKASGVILLNHEVVELARDFGEHRALKIIERAKILASRCDLLKLPYWILAVYVFEQLEDGNKFLEAIAECDDSGKRDGNPIHAYTFFLKKWRALKGGSGSINKQKWLGMFMAYDAMIKGNSLKTIRVSGKQALIYPENYKNYQEV